MAGNQREIQHVDNRVETVDILPDHAAQKNRRFHFMPQGADSPYQGESARRANRGRDAGAKRLRGFERNRFRISKHSELCNKSPPSFSPKMTPPLTARGVARGGFGGSPANPYHPTSFKRKAFLPQPFKRNGSQTWSHVTGGAYHSARAPVE